MIFLKSVVGGVVAVLAMWFIIVSFDLWRIHETARRQGITGLVAVAGGWEYLLHKPLTLFLLTVAFGLGLSLIARYSR